LTKRIHSETTGLSYNQANLTSVSYLIYDGQPVRTKDLQKVVFLNCDETLKNATPVALPVPGMKYIKRTELWLKWHPLIPVERQKDWFFLHDPGPGMAKHVLAKRVERLARREREVTPSSLVARAPPN
jgi:hypothetical protein